MASVMFYQKPVLLNRELHRNRKIQPSSSLAFTRQANSMYLAGVEFGEACKEYPIVFTKMPTGKVAPVALLGLRDQENLYLDAQGKWDGRYIPAFVRRYPFVLAELADGQLGVCVDEAFSGLNDQQGEAMFDEKGANTPFLQSALDFLNRYQLEFMRTDTFCQRLHDAGLLMEMNAKADLFDGSSFMINGLMVVDERKLLQVSDKQALEIFRAGELSWVYSHLISLGNLNRLVDKLADLKRADGSGAPQPAAASSNKQA